MNSPEECVVQAPKYWVIIYKKKKMTSAKASKLTLAHSTYKREKMLKQFN